MSTTSHIARPMAASLLDRAGETLANAFISDPMASYFFPSASGRGPKLRRIFRSSLRYGLAYGEVDEVHDGEGVAIWLRSDHAKRSLARLLRAGALAAAWAVGWHGTRRIRDFLRFIEQEHLQAISEPHWYLFSMAVHPARQGQGLGAALLRQGLARARAEARPCLLETTNDRNLTFYEKHSFRVVREAQPPNGGPRLWLLLAEPRSLLGVESVS